MFKLARSICRRLAPATLLFAAWVHHDARAASPPDMPLPPCVEEDGEQTGACPQLSDDVTGEASGAFTAGGAVMITTVPTHDVCVHHNGYPPYPWTPSPCYSGISAPSVAGCAVIDLQDGGRFRELPCSQALYKDPADAPAPMFTATGPDGGTRCSASGNFYTYVYGGPANVEGARWSEFGPAYLECQLRFEGTRPDGLYGPTWVKINVGISQSQDGDERRGYSRTAQFYVPIDGDLREETIDVSLLATSSLEQAGDVLTATLTAALTNHGTKDAEHVKLTFVLPEQMHFMSISEPRCSQPGSGPFVGDGVTCEGLRLAGTGDELGSDVEIIDLVARITNAADLEEVSIEAEVADDIDPSDNQDSLSLEPTLRAGSTAETREMMRVLDPYFDYETHLEDFSSTACNGFMDEIWNRLEEIRVQHPTIFEDLAYGRITSRPDDSQSARGHVGVVVYPKGTDYHQTGIVIHGTAGPSRYPYQSETQVGSYPLGMVPPDAGFGTSLGLDLLRTPIQSFQGSPNQESPVGCGFEGAHSDNADEFASTPPAGCTGATVQTCPFAPDAVAVATESPVEILVTNSRGQRVETMGGEVSIQELDGGIHSYMFPHEDGSYAWNLILPEDDYDIQLVGTAEGPYRLTLTTFDENGEPVEVVAEGQTQPGQVDEYELAGAPAEAPEVGGDDSSGGDGGSGGGSGGALGWPSLLALLPLALLRRRQRTA